MPASGILKLASVALLSAVAACGANSGRAATSPDLLPVPTSSWRPGDASLLALASGTLEGGDKGGRYCVWLSNRTGPHPVVWPAGYQLRRHPIELLNAGGAVVARPGDHITFGGGVAPARPDRACMLGRRDALYVMSQVSAIRAPSE